MTDPSKETSQRLHERRQFLGCLATAAASGVGATWGATASVAQAAAATQSKQPICLFEKFLQDLSYDQLADVVAAMEVAGIEATVRQGGHVAPERVDEELPLMVEALAQRNLQVTILTSDVLSVDEPLSQRVLQTAAELGIKRFRMGSYRYDLQGDVHRQMREFGAALRDVATLSGDLGLTALYQNHSGADYFGATLWDAYQQCKEIPVEQLGLAFDIRHATIEAGLAWPLVYRVVRPQIGALFVKDFRWEGDKAVHAPLGQGRVDPKFLSQALKDGFSGPISLHVEYLPKEGTQENIKALQRDLAVLRDWLGA